MLIKRQLKIFKSAVIGNAKRSRKNYGDYDEYDLDAEGWRLDFAQPLGNKEGHLVLTNEKKEDLEIKAN